MVRLAGGPPAAGGGAVAVPRPTPLPGIDRAVERSILAAPRWAALPLQERAALLDGAAYGLRRVAGAWVAGSLAAKGVPGGGMAEAEEWLFLATVFRSLHLLSATLRRLAGEGPPAAVPGPPRRVAGGRLAVGVFPVTRRDRLVYRGMTGEVWSVPGPEAAGLRQRPPRNHGEVAAVLGAGNASMLPAVDALHQLAVEGRAVVLKPNPVNAYLGPLIEQAFAALVDPGYLQVVHGGAEEGAALCRHPGVDAVHLTGSHATYEAVAGDGALGKRVGAELGNVSPVIVVPGPWSDRDVARQAGRVATWLVAGAGFGCLTPRVLVQHRGWPLRDALLQALAGTLSRVGTRPAYYPGAAARFEAFVEAHPGAWRLGSPATGHLPWGVVPGVDPAATDDLCFRREAFCGLLAETALEAPDPAAFVDRAAAFADDVLWGSLNATLLVHPASMADPPVAEAVERAVARLRYGTVTVNSAAFAAYHLQVLPWGAFPVRDGEPVTSGLGRTANGLMLGGPAGSGATGTASADDVIEKSVLRGPFAGGPDPLTVHARRPDVFARTLAADMASPSVAALPALGTALVRATLPTPRSNR